MSFIPNSIPFLTLPTKFIMRAILASCLFSACLAVAATAADNASDVKVQASSDLRVAVLDMTLPGPDRDAVHDAFAATLGASMSKQCGGPVVVKVTEVDAFRLSFDLKAGVYDAAFIIGDNVPQVLRKGNFEILRAVSDVGTPGRVFHMVIPTDDAGLQKMITASFAEALAASKFQQAVARAVAIHVNADAIKRAAKESVADTTR